MFSRMHHPSVPLSPPAWDTGPTTLGQGTVAESALAHGSQQQNGQPTNDMMSLVSRMLLKRLQPQATTTTAQHPLPDNHERTRMLHQHAGLAGGSHVRSFAPPGREPGIVARGQVGNQQGHTAHMKNILRESWCALGGAAECTMGRCENHVALRFD